jgi:ubiquinone/menaquinone biosynthesis C-methylase UbiE
MDTQVLDTQTLDAQTLEIEKLEKIRQQFDQIPYPRIPLEGSPKYDLNELYLHSLITANYIRQRRVVQPQGKLILDAGCGSGYKSLILAEANPGAKIIGIDLSDNSVKLARERLKYHGFDNVEFHTMLIDDLPKLGLKFDYINCDEVLYLLPDPVAGLKAMKSVLSPEGILRANLHHAYQRAACLRSQALFQLMGLMDGERTDETYEAVAETMRSLKNGVKLKVETWSNIQCEDPNQQAEMISTNYLLQNDKGFTIPDLFSMLSETGLAFVSMVDWRRWDVTELFQDLDNLPALWDVGLAYASEAEKLRLYELLNPIHRLMDFWCTHSEVDELDREAPVDEWTDEAWRSATIHLHPHLMGNEIHQEVIEIVEQSGAFNISRYIPHPALSPIVLDSTMAACLLPLWDCPQSMRVLVERYRQIRAVHPVTLEPTSEAIAFRAMRELLSRLEAFLYVLVEKV